MAHKPRPPMEFPSIFDIKTPLFLRMERNLTFFSVLLMFFFSYCNSLSFNIPRVHLLEHRVGKQITYWEKDQF